MTQTVVLPPAWVEQVSRYPAEGGPTGSINENDFFNNAKAKGSYTMLK